MDREKFTIRHATGRLVEARVFALWTPSDADAYATELQRVVQTFPTGLRPVLLADHRPVKVYPTAVIDRLYELFANMNLQLERAALLLTQGNVPLTVQLSRLVDDAANSKRRLFSQPVDALAHLAPGFDQTERTRAAAFLNEL